MKSLIIGAALLAATIPALAQTNVSISVGQPGFYGQIDIGDYGRPPVVYERPVIIRPAPRYQAQPLYLRVPPGHRNKWAKHCSRYNACGRPVYFVTDDWYARTYVPRYQEQYRDHHRGQEQRQERYEYREQEHGGGNGHGKGHDKDHDKGHGKGRGHGDD
jgi:hypothetical protein